jgi:hypothetical protein
MHFKYVDNARRGFSGSKVTIDTIGEKVEKTDSSKSGILEYQFRALKYFSSTLKGKIRVPKVINFSTTDGYEVLSLELISGPTLHHIFQTGDLLRASLITNSLWFEWTEFLSSHSFINFNCGLKDIQNYKNKLQLIEISANRYGMKNHKVFQECFQSVVDIKASATGVCHGDFTIDNIIIANNYFYLIDFIPSPFPSIEQDLSKLIQDGITGWAMRYVTNNSFNFELFIVVDKLVKDALNKDLVDYDRLKKLSFLSFLRIVPYIKNESEAVVWLQCLIRLRAYFL